MNKKFVAGAVLIACVVIALYSIWRGLPYYNKYTLIAHALGGIDNTEYTNSIEAMEYSYSMGNRLMEVDLLMTKDNHLVARHNWNNDLGDDFSSENVPDYETFMSFQILGKYSPVDIETLVLFAKEHPDIYFVTDIKSYKTDMTQMLLQLIEAATRLGLNDYQERFIIQIYNYENFNEVKKEVKFNHYIFTLYRMKDALKNNKIDEIILFCTNNDIKVITIPKAYVTKEIVKKVNHAGIKLYVNTINSKKEMLRLQLMGVKGVYTDDIYMYPLVIFLTVIMVIGFMFMILALTMIRMIRKNKALLWLKYYQSIGEMEIE